MKASGQHLDYFTWAERLEQFAPDVLVGVPERRLLELYKDARTVRQAENILVNERKVGRGYSAGITSTGREVMTNQKTGEKWAVLK